MTRIRTFFVVALLALVAVPSALAAANDLYRAGYDGEGGGSQDQVSSGEPTPPSTVVLPPSNVASEGPPTEAVSGGLGGVGTDPGDALPFTGLNLVLILVGGIVLVATGILLRRRKQDENPT